MIGAIIGDIVGSKYEFHPICKKEFPFFSSGCNYTDDTIMTLAVAKALMRSVKEKVDFKETLIPVVHEFGRNYRCPMGGYGRRFLYEWIMVDDPKPYNSLGNGAAMRVSSCGYFAKTLEQALQLAKESSEITHNHPEGIKGAQATAAAIFLARKGCSKAEIKEFIEQNFYKLDKTLKEIKENYGFYETSPETVPQAIQAFLEADSYEDTIRNVVSLGGDCDTQGAIAGAIAWAFYNRDGVTPENEEFRKTALSYLPEYLKNIVFEFDAFIQDEEE